MVSRGDDELDGDDEHLRRAREIVDGVQRTIASGEGWDAIDAACRVLQREHAAEEAVPVSAPRMEPAPARVDLPVPARPPPPPMAPPPRVEPPPPVMAGAPAEENVDGTLPLDSEKVLLAPAVLPFVRGSGQAPPAAVDAEEDHDALGATVALDPERRGDRALPFGNAVDDALGDTAPAAGEAEPSEEYEPTERFRSEPDALPEHLRAMTIEQYAALCAECAVHGSWAKQIQARYQVRSEAERAALDRYWRARMAGDEQLATQWRWHHARYEAWARQHKG